MKKLALLALMSLTLVTFTNCGNDDEPDAPGQVETGSCGTISSCDSRISIQFSSCQKISKGTVKISYFITNYGADINGMRLWQHENLTYFTDNLGNRYGTSKSTWGNASGTGDLSVPLGNGEYMLATHYIDIDPNASYISSARITMSPFGTGDWVASSKYATFYNIRWD